MSTQKLTPPITPHGTPKGTPNGNLVQVIEDMIILLEQENHAVKSSDFGVFNDLQQKKVDLFTAIHDLSVQADQGALATIALQPGASDKLKSRLNAAVENNRHTLEIASKSMGRLLDRIANAARQAAMEDRKYYGASGTLAQPQSKSAISITLNENA